MSRCNLDDCNEFQNRKRHKALLRKDEERAIRIIKKELPRGYTLKEYLEELRAEIEAEKK